MFRLYVLKYDQGAVVVYERHCTYSILFIGNGHQSFCDYRSNKNVDLMSLAIVIKQKLQTTDQTRALLQ